MLTYLILNCVRDQNLTIECKIGALNGLVQNVQKCLRYVIKQICLFCFEPVLTATN